MRRTLRTRRVFMRLREVRLIYVSKRIASIMRKPSDAVARSRKV